MELNKDFLTREDAWRNEEIYKKIYEYSINDPDGYWNAQLDRLDWIQKPNIITKQKEDGHTLWFPDGKINACYNCVDRHAEKTPNKTALIWQSENLENYQYISFQKLKEETCRFANTLKKLGLTRKDYITIYMPMVPEAVYACLACARLGIPYSAVFAGFSPSAIALRMNDCNSSFIISCDGNMRGGKIIPLKNNVDATRELCPDRTIRSLIVKRQNIDINWDDNIDFDYYKKSKLEVESCYYYTLPYWMGRYYGFIASTEA